METFLSQIPDHIQDHIREITVQSGLPQGEDAVEALSEGWLKKNHLFDRYIENASMQAADSLDVSFLRGAIILTYSGSLLTLFPAEETAERSVQYTSIGLRHDVPDTAIAQKTKLLYPVLRDKPARFSRGPIQRSSSVYKIAVLPEILPDDTDENSLLAVLTQSITEGFVSVNRDMLSE